ncbi:MAG: outer membrane beta-barrel protein, partial [Thermodesulfobacteriota bacterium]
MKSFSIGLIVMAFLGFPWEVDGGGLRLGPLIVTPYVNASGTYTDNVFLTKSNKKSDFYYSVLPGIKVRARPIGRHNFHLDYDADISQFSSYS